MPRIALNGIHLNVSVAGEGPPLVLLHGFTGSSGTWTPFSDAWSSHCQIGVDIIGHGASDSPGDPDRYRVERCIEDVVGVLDHLDVQRATVLGYSMGGRVALRFALTAPERVNALILESASPGIADASDRVSRLAADAALATMIEEKGLEPFIEYWERIPLWASQATLPEASRARLRRQRMTNNPGGLANSLRGMGAGHEVSVLDRMGEIAVPTLLLAGALDTKYSELSTEMARRLRSVRLEIVAKAGHTVHLEQPDTFSRLVTEFLASLL